MQTFVRGLASMSGRPAQVYVGVVVGDKVAQEMLPAAKVLGLLAHGLTPMFSVR